MVFVMIFSPALWFIAPVQGRGERAEKRIVFPFSEAAGI
jgi:hypothetical protein